MIWLCVFPDAGRAQRGARATGSIAMSPLVRTFVLATIAVPIVIYGLMPHLQRARGRLFSRRDSVARSAPPSTRPARRN
jgi:hypothetical protein